MKALSPKDIARIKYSTLQLSPAWHDAFGEVEDKGVWIIWGNSGNGKTSFTLQLCKELSRHGKVLYNSLEEGMSYTMSNAIERAELIDCKHINFVQESIEKLTERLQKQKAPRFIVIDSYQYTQMTYKQYLAFKEAHRNKLIIFISHADGNNPSGRSARSVMYDATLKVFVQGYRAFSKGRFIGPVGYIDVWAEQAAKFWGEATPEPEDMSDDEFMELVNKRLGSNNSKAWEFMKKDVDYFSGNMP